MSKEIELLKEAIKILEEREKSSKVQLSTLKPGEIFKVGEHDFVVLKQGEEVTHVISKDFMAENIKFDENTRDYKKSNLKKVIERDIQLLIEKEVGTDNIIEHEVDLTSADMQNEFGKCKCKVRPLTFDEVRGFNDLIVNENLDDWCWTCTPWSAEKRGYKYSIAVVLPSGSISLGICGNRNGVRPVCILKSNIFVSKGEN